MLAGSQKHLGEMGGGGKYPSAQDLIPVKFESHVGIQASIPRTPPTPKLSGCVGFAVRIKKFPFRVLGESLRFLLKEMSEMKLEF